MDQKNSNKIALLTVDIQDIWKYDTNMKTKLQNVTFYYWVIQLIYALAAKKIF